MNLSDHEGVYISRKKPKEKSNTKFLDARSYIHYDRNKFHENLLDKNWNEFYNVQDVNLAWEYMERQITEEINKQCPPRKIKIKDKQDPWITHEIIEMIHDKDRLRKIAYKSKKQNDHDRSKTVENETKQMVKRARADFIKTNLELYRNDPKQFWEQINGILPSKAKQQYINLFDHTNNENINTGDTADFINN